MLPYITIGQFRLSLYYTAMVLGYVMMVVLMLWKQRRSRYSMKILPSFLFATAELIFGVLGCKILFILENIGWIRKNGFTLGGFSFYGAVFLIPLTMPLIGKMMKLGLRASLDHAAVCITAMLGTIRIGCFLNGCCGGRVLGSGEFLFTLPTQLIECICDFLILSRLLTKEEKMPGGGLLYPEFLYLYGGARFIIEFFRNTDKNFLYLSNAQWFSVLSVLIGLTAAVLLKKKRENAVSDHA